MMYRLWRYDVMLRIMMLLVFTRNDAMFANASGEADIISEGYIILHTQSARLDLKVSPLFAKNHSPNGFLNAKSPHGSESYSH